MWSQVNQGTCLFNYTTILRRETNTKQTNKRWYTVISLKRSKKEKSHAKKQK